MRHRQQGVERRGSKRAQHGVVFDPFEMSLAVNGFGRSRGACAFDPRIFMAQFVTSREREKREREREVMFSTL